MLRRPPARSKPSRGVVLEYLARHDAGATRRLCLGGGPAGAGVGDEAGHALGAVDRVEHDALGAREELDRLDAASRLMGFMLEHDPERSRGFLHRFKQEVDTKKVWMMWDREAYFDFLRAVPGQVANEVKRIADEDAAGREEGAS